MNQDETVDFLTALTAHDRRTVGNGDVVLWQAALSDVPLELALSALVAHIRESSDWTQVAHIRKHAKLIHTDRRMRESEPERQARIAATEAKQLPNIAEAARRQREIARFTRGAATVPDDAA
jgi:hypothetical protein